MKRLLLKLLIDIVRTLVGMTNTPPNSIRLYGQISWSTKKGKLRVPISTFDSLIRGNCWGLLCIHEYVLITTLDISGSYGYFNTRAAYDHDIFQESAFEVLICRLLIRTWTSTTRPFNWYVRYIYPRLPLSLNFQVLQGASKFQK